MAKNANNLHFNCKKSVSSLTLFISLALVHSVIGCRLALPQDFFAEGDSASLQPKLDSVQLRTKPLKEDYKNTSSEISPSEAKAIIEQRAKEVILTIKNQDMVKLSSFVHSEKGVRFSTYSHINKNSDRVFYRPQVRKFLTDNKKYIWGAYDGSGTPIEMTPRQYFNSFIYKRDFASARQIGYNQILGRGNSINNSFEVYPKAIIVEYYFPGFDPKYAGMDWESLRLVFEEKGNNWYLVGIIHDQWTI